MILAKGKICWLVISFITWNMLAHEFITRGLSSCQGQAAPQWFSSPDSSGLFFFQSYIRNYSSVPLFLMSKLELWLRFGGALRKNRNPENLSWMWSVNFNIQVLGRHVRDFVNGLDNLHEYLRFSYPKVQPPTFFCQEESATGVTLHYRSVASCRKRRRRRRVEIVGKGKQRGSWGIKRSVASSSPSVTRRSKRKGYLHYAMGQLRQMGKQFYDTDIHVEVLSEQMVGDYSHVTMRYEHPQPRQKPFGRNRLLFYYYDYYYFTLQHMDTI